MRAAVLHGPRDIRVETVPDPECGEHDIVLEIAACGVCGSDLHMYTKAMFMEPGQIAGHEFSGRVVAVGNQVDGIEVSQRVTASPNVDCGRCARCSAGEPLLCENQAGNVISAGLPGAFAELVRIPKARLGQTVFQLPDSMAFETAALIEPYAVGLHIAHNARPGLHDTAVVFGLGMIGLAAVQTLMLAGAARVIGVDRSAKRLAAGLEVGAESVVDASSEGWKAELAELTGGGSAGYGGAQSGNVDIVCECTGSPVVLRTAIETARRGGRLVVVALYEETAELDPNQIVIKDLRMHGSFGYGSGAFRGFPDALSLLDEGKLATEPLITHRLELGQIESAFEAQLDRDESIKVMVNPHTG